MPGRDMDPKRVYYMSMEFLMGRSLTNALNNLDVVDPYAQALRDMGCALHLLGSEDQNSTCSHCCCNHLCTGTLVLLESSSAAAKGGALTMHASHT